MISHNVCETLTNKKPRKKRIERENFIPYMISYMKPQTLICKKNHFRDGMHQYWWRWQWQSASSTSSQATTLENKKNLFRNKTVVATPFYTNTTNR